MPGPPDPANKLLLTGQSRKNALAHLAPLTDGILIGWSIFNDTQLHFDSLALHRPPWRDPTPLNLHPPSGITSMTADPDAPILALATSLNVALYDSTSWEPILNLPTEKTHHLTLRNGLLAHVNHDLLFIAMHLRVHRIVDGASVLRAKIDNVPCVAIHPSGWIVTGGTSIRIARTGVDKTLREPKGYAASNKSLVAVYCLNFTRDGRWLLCGTTDGMRVYDWHAVEASAMNMSQPTWQHSPRRSRGSTNNPRMPKVIYALAEEPSGNAALFAGMLGTISRMDLRTGEVTQLLELPHDGPIIDMALSADGRALATVSRPGLTINSTVNADTTVVRLWDYAAISK